LKSFQRSSTRSYAMTATPSIDLPGWMAEQLSQASRTCSGT
jgi:hypothetical protein